jgi:cytochrome c-type biogenesis protein CcmH/NrfF
MQQSGVTARQGSFVEIGRPTVITPVPVVWSIPVGLILLAGIACFFLVRRHRRTPVH